MLHACRSLWRTLPFVPMALGTYDVLEHRLQAAGLLHTSATTPSSSLILAPGATRAKERLATPKPIRSGSSSSGAGNLGSETIEQVKWFSSSAQAPFFISPKHDGVRLISYVAPAAAATAAAEAGAAPATSSRAAASRRKALRQPVSSAAIAPAAPLTCFSRYGRPIYGLSWIEEELALLRALAGDPALIVDGELYLHQDEMVRVAAAASSSCRGKRGAPRARATKPAATPLPKATATAAAAAKDERRAPRGTSSTFQTGFLAVSALVHRLRGASNRGATAADVLRYVPSLPHLCVFDVPSYSPCPNPVALPPQAGRVSGWRSTDNGCVGGGVDGRVAAELDRVRTEVLRALRVHDVEQLRVVPNLTTFTQRLRTMHFLLELLARGTASPILLQHFCTSTAAATGHGAPADRASCVPAHGAVARYHGGRFVRRIPYQLVDSLEDATARVLPTYVRHGYEGAVIRAPINTYEFKEKAKGTLAALVAPLLRASAPTSQGRGKRGRAKVDAARRATARDALLRAIAVPQPALVVRTYRGPTPSVEQVALSSLQCAPPPSSIDLAEAALCAADAAELGRKALLRCAKLSLRSSTAVKLLTYHDREYAILRPLLKEPSTNPNTRELVSLPRSYVEGLGYNIKPNTDAPAATASGSSVVCFYGLQCLADSGVAFNVSLPKLTLATQKALLEHLLSAGRTKPKPAAGKCRSSAKATSGPGTGVASLTGLYATVKYSTLTENGLPRFGSVKAIRGGKGWFM